MNITIEPVKIEELEPLVNISRQTFYQTFFQQNSKEDMELFVENALGANALKAELLADYNFFFFAKIGNEIVGYLKLSTQGLAGSGSDGVLEISRIYVVQEKLGSGVGKALLQFALSFAEQNKKNSLILGVWEKNERAIKFYRSYGFEKFDEHIFMLGNDAQTDWLMKKEVGS
jgi:ribosomal protein S18 acetylase RimI-like enzyme